MKSIKLIIVIAVVVALTWFVIKPGTPDIQIAETTETPTMTDESSITDFENKATITEPTPNDIIDTSNAMSYYIAENSQVLWYAEKAGGSHNGYINITNWSMVTSEGNVIGGKVSLDMQSLKPTDIESEQLETHLKSADFFEVDTYPNWEFQLTTIQDQKVTGLLTLKWITKQISFEATNISLDDNTANIQAQFAIDRNQRNITGQAGIVSDYIQLTVDLTFNK